MSSLPAALSCGLAGIWLCRRHGVEVWRVADAASIPMMACIAIGRWGCFLNGCCYGVSTTRPWGVHFPRLYGAVHPTQVYYAVGAFCIALFLWGLERWIGQGDRSVGVPLLWPVLMILYGTERFLVDILRDGDRIAGLKVGQGLGFCVAFAGLFWLLHSLVVLREARGGRMNV